MSAVGYLLGGGIASIGGDIPNDEQKKINESAKSFATKVKSRALRLQIPVSSLNILKASFLFIGKDTQSYHYIFAESFSGTTITYRDFTQHGRLELGTIAHQVRLEIGDVVWGFSLVIGAPDTEKERLLESFAQQYVDSVMELRNN